MGRWRQIRVGLLAAYAASMTLLAARWAAESWSIQRIFSQLTGAKDGVVFDFSRHQDIFNDVGVRPSTWESFVMTIAGLKPPTLAAMIGVIFIGVMAVASLRLHPRSRLDKD